jgi:hypothetical protein
MADKLKINPALIAALEHYAAGRYSPVTPSLYVHRDENGHQHSWTIDRACGVAAEILGDEELNFLKLKTLQEGLRQFGMERLYEKIMSEKLP